MPLKSQFQMKEKAKLRNALNSWKRSSNDHREDFKKGEQYFKRPWLNQDQQRSIPGKLSLIKFPPKVKVRERNTAIQLWAWKHKRNWNLIPMESNFFQSWEEDIFMGWQSYRYTKGVDVKKTS